MERQLRNFWVLDNEVQILNVLDSFIQEAGYVFIDSSDPIDSLSFLEKTKVDLILTNYSMRDMNGSKLPKKRAHRASKVLFCI
jgi:two-component SAPR family response regulator